MELTWATPLSCQPPSTGDGITTDAAAAACEPAAPVSKPPTTSDAAAVITVALSCRGYVRRARSLRFACFGALKRAPTIAETAVAKKMKVRFIAAPLLAPRSK